MSKLFYVGDEYRTNPLSLIPGGYKIIVWYRGAGAYTYDKVKNPELYIKKFKDDPCVIKWKVIGSDG